MMVDAVGIQLILLYRIVGPVAITIMPIMFLAGVGKMALEIIVRDTLFFMYMDVDCG